MQCALPLSPATFPPDHMSTLSLLSFKKGEVLDMLAQERTNPLPNEAIVAACEIWLNVYNDATRRAAALAQYRALQGDA